MGKISIHAAQEGCDSALRTITSLFCYFNPRSPRGLRRIRRLEYTQRLRNFNPRSPRGLRPKMVRSLSANIRFQSTQPKRAATLLFQQRGYLTLFQSTQPKRAATKRFQR